MNHLPKPSTLTRAEFSAVTYFFQRGLVCAACNNFGGIVPKDVRKLLWRKARVDARLHQLNRSNV